VVFDTGRQKLWFCQRSRQSRRHELEEEFSSCGLEHRQHSLRTTEMKVTAAIGVDLLAVTGSGAEEIAELVVASTERRGSESASFGSHGRTKSAGL
jgi:hypothetical protein